VGGRPAISSYQTTRHGYTPPPVVLGASKCAVLGRGYEKSLLKALKLFRKMRGRICAKKGSEEKNKRNQGKDTRGRREINKNHEGVRNAISEGGETRTKRRFSASERAMRNRRVQVAT